MPIMAKLRHMWKTDGFFCGVINEVMRGALFRK